MIDARPSAPLLVWRKVLLRHIEIGAVPVTRHRDIGQMLIHHPGGQHEGAVDRRSLRFVHRRGITMIDIAIGLLAEGDLATCIELDCQQRIAAIARRANHGA